MYEPKMKETDRDVIEFIEAVEHPKRREDAYRFLDIFTLITGKQAKMWGPSIIGFGSYHYKYDSGHEGDAPVVGFSPRKARHSLYFMLDSTERDKLLTNFGKHKASKGCVYVNKIEDINLEVLEELIRETVEHIDELYGID
ncbi:DUF1801 domain-containing protein [Oceanobacillus sp. FSL H7-0719]|uniref:DUF1801 domain-containing protein n=1 Tax=Oceanobacillus sp. FSL H7-0719 TaxID=2954507 RepID=UPI00324CE4C3